MPTTIKLKNSVTTTNAPSSLVQGEVAINITDKKVWVGNAATTPIQLLGDGASGSFGALSCTSLTNSGLTSGRVTYATTGGLLTDSANLTFNGTTLSAAGLSDSGNLTFTGTGNRITGDFTNTTLANRVMFQTSTANSTSNISVLPSGTGTSTQLNLYGASDPDNANRARLAINNSAFNIVSDITGTGTYVPIALYTGGSERLRIDTSGNVGIGTSSPTANFTLTLGSLARLKMLPTTNTLATYVDIESASGNFYMGIDSSTAGVFGQGNYSRVIYSTGAYPLVLTTNGSERMRIDSSGNVGIGNTPSGTSATGYRSLELGTTAGTGITAGNGDLYIPVNAYVAGGAWKYAVTSTASLLNIQGGLFTWSNAVSGTAGNNISFSERMRITSGGTVCVGKTSDSLSVAGAYISPAGEVGITQSGGAPLYINRLTNDGVLVQFRQDNTNEGDISVSGTTVSYNGGHLSRWAQTLTPKDDSLVKGTVLSNLDEMNEYVDADGNPVPNEQLNKVKVSDVEGDANVAGVFVNWSFDEQHNVDEINMAMTGDMIIRIAEGVTVARGDLLMSAGDGTAKPQGDDIVRSKTIAKVTSNHVTCTYADGSYCVPCVLMAC
jgi:hypothetical protein